MHEGRQYKKALKIVDQVRSCPKKALNSFADALDATMRASRVPCSACVGCIPYLHRVPRSISPIT